MRFTGTEKQHVADDYALRLAGGNAECKVVVDEALSTMMSGMFHALLCVYLHDVDTQRTKNIGNADTLTFAECPFLNQSICEATSSGSSCHCGYDHRT